MDLARPAFLLLAAALVLAGCSAPVTTPTLTGLPVQDPDWAVRALFAGADPLDSGHVADHDHLNRSLHKGLSTPNFQVLGHNGLASPYFERAAGTYYCGDVATEGPRQLAVVHSFQTDVAIQVLDVTNRSEPQVLGELVLPYVFTYDAAIFADGRYAAIAGNPDLASDKPAVAALRAEAEATGRVPFQPYWRTPCGTFAMKSNVDSVPYGYAVLLVDLADPTDPTVVSSYEYPGGRNVHSISTAIVDGTRFLATSGLMAVPCTIPSVPGNPVPNPVPCEPQVPRFGNALSHFDFLTVNDAGPRAQLLLHSIYTPSDQTHLDPSLLYLSNGHTDATVEKHPVTGQTVAYLADWDGGLHIVRLDGPQQVVPLASWGAAPGGDPTQMRGHIHSVAPVPELRDGKRYLLVGQEMIGRPAGRPTGQVAILDVTDPAAPLRGAKWTLPVDVQWSPRDGELFSTHYTVLQGDTLFVSLYHGGVWAADAGRANWPDLPTTGVFVPDANPAGIPFKQGPSPEILEVLDLRDGSLLVFDGNTGAYTVRFTGAHPDVPAAAPWPENPWMG